MARLGKVRNKTPRSTASAKKTVPPKTKSIRQYLYTIPRVVFEPSIIEPYYAQSYIRQHAKFLRNNLTPAEKYLARFLNNLNNGVLKGRFVIQHVVSGKWIVDFFFPENRLAIEIDGDYHSDPKQKIKDKIKEKDCRTFDITLIRLSNTEVFGDQKVLTEKLREGWRKALRRKNTIIGTKA
jgi:very-short-patch-repair endonuclease/ribosomal protein S30